MYAHVVHQGIVLPIPVDSLCVGHHIECVRNGKISSDVITNIAYDIPDKIYDVGNHRSRIYLGGDHLIGSLHEGRVIPVYPDEVGKATKTLLYKELGNNSWERLYPCNTHMLMHHHEIMHLELERTSNYFMNGLLIYND